MTDGVSLHMYSPEVISVAANAWYDGANHLYIFHAWFI